MVGVLVILMLVELYAPVTPWVRWGPIDAVLGEAYDATQTAPVWRVVGSFNREGHRIDFDTTHDGARSSGTASVDGLRLEFREVDSHLYVRAGADFWRTTPDRYLLRVFADRWVRPHASVSSPVFDVTRAGWSVHRPRRLLSQAVPTLSGWSRGEMETLHRVRAARFESARWTVWISTARPLRILRIASKPLLGEPEPSDVRADLSYPGTPSIEAPASFLDGNDLTSLPAYYQVEPNSFRYGTCDLSGCEASLGIRNAHGAHVGPPSKALYTLRHLDGAIIASCEAPIPPIAARQVRVVSCRVSGPGWEAYLRGGSEAMKDAKAEFVVTNPLYDPS